MGKRYIRVDVGDKPLLIQIKRHHRARHVSLRMDVAAGRPVLVLPRQAPLNEGLAFANTKRQWLEKNLEALPPKVPFAHGVIIPILGVDHIVSHVPWWRGTVRRGTDLLGDAILEVGGKSQHLSRRLGDWLREEARREITPLAMGKAQKVGRRPKRIAIRDTHSCWGSCSPQGALSFCWRLVLAPAWVLDYVVAHEVAHMVHLDHSHDFWRQVNEITSDMEAAYKWIYNNGPSLLRYG